MDNDQERMTVKCLSMAPVSTCAHQHPRHRDSVGDSRQTQLFKTISQQQHGNTRLQKCHLFDSATNQISLAILGQSAPPLQLYGINVQVKKKDTRTYCQIRKTKRAEAEGEESELWYEGSGRQLHSTVRKIIIKITVSGDNFFFR
ncbi:hypothetical protein KQX54_021626 [Cotesia glomerata]|uniref:Uncharacterized protein n=1 Tax=Cotesia glomerata TaxID=32391 RepID=A0AAV7J9W8_COTGL|nr:hypothetical protein KQX54_021626 [Cotesia glomerata]